MLELNRPEPPKPANEDITKNVANSLKSKGIKVIIVDSPVIKLENTADGFCLEMVSRRCDDIQYAIDAIVDYNPIVVFLRSVEFAEGTHYRIRFQYLALERPMAEPMAPI